MKHRSFFLLLALTGTLSAAAVTPIVYNGDTLELNTEFRRTRTGAAPTKFMPEISGMSCSRTTPGYFWVQSDDNYYVASIDAKGNIYSRLKLTNKPSRSDWEGLSTGIYQGKNYLFVGGFGDNNLKYKDKYYIFYFEEPTIPSTAKTATTLKDSSVAIYNQYIWYGYPDTLAHNTEAVMYDNVDQVLYIIDKVEKNVCSVFSLPMDTVYPSDVIQRPKKECELGKQGELQFQRVTAADITPDGRWILIKNNYYVPKGTSETCYSYTLIWERHMGESVVDALLRQPKQVAAYLVEWQGETLAWLDSTTFYTTSDESDDDPPIYKYTRWQTTDIPSIEASAPTNVQKIMLNGQVFIRVKDEDYTLSGQAL